jgi:hypothetical protein
MIESNLMMDSPQSGRGLYDRVHFQMQNLSLERGHKARAYMFREFGPKSVLSATLE